MILTQRHDGVMPQWPVFVESANKPVFVYLQTESDTWDLIFIEKTQNILHTTIILMTKIMIHTIMNACVHLIILILFNIFYK